MDFIPKALGFMNPESLHRQQVERLHGGDIWPLVLGEVFLDVLYVVLVDCTPSPKTNTPLAPEVRASISSCLGSFWSLLPRCSLTGSGTQTLLAMDAIWSENLPNAPQTVPQGGTLCCVCASARTHTPVCVCVHACQGPHVAIRGQLVGQISPTFCVPCQAWKQALYPLSHLTCP